MAPSGASPALGEKSLPGIPLWRHSGLSSALPAPWLPSLCGGAGEGRERPDVGVTRSVCELRGSQRVPVCGTLLWPAPT